MQSSAAAESLVFSWAFMRSAVFIIFIFLATGADLDDKRFRVLEVDSFSYSYLR